MNKNSKIKGENVKEIAFEVKDLNLDERVSFNKAITNNGNLTGIQFGDFVEAVRLGTKLTDDDINKFTDTEIISIANRCYEVINKKKLKKSI